MSPASRAVILDETIARKLFGEANPVGQFLHAGDSWPALEVIGVAKDVIHQSLRGGPRPSVYSIAAPNSHYVLSYFNARTLGNPLIIAGAIRQVVRELDPKVEVAGLQTMTALIDDQLFRERSLSSLVGFFSLLALVLACLGLYGTLSYGVVRRTREIGVRKALGARRRDIQVQFLIESTALSVLGGLLGIALGVWLARFVGSKGISTYVSPASVVLAFGCAAAIGIFFGYYPAGQAGKLDPIEALRYE